MHVVACAMPSANCGFDTVDCGSSRGYSLRRSSIGPPICCFSGSLGFDTASCDAGRLSSIKCTNSTII
ncbi:Loss of heterozygosity 11 chromosomal region 2 gene A protein like [Schistosoma japonicum]|nr:Loss of heterozygosity 11 chromosomal region 2 gene A protein like [Schistosoma japonicum]